MEEGLPPIPNQHQSKARQQTTELRNRSADPYLPWNITAVTVGGGIVIRDTDRSPEQFYWC
jgi:hypothetical protein